MKKKYLIFLLIMLCVNAILLLLFLNPKITSFIFSKVNFKKSFVNQLNEFPKEPYQFKINKGTYHLTPSDNYTMLAKVINKPFFDNKTQRYILPVEFLNNKKERINIKVVLGNKNKEVLVLRAQMGQIPNQQNWTGKLVPTLLELIEINTPVILELVHLKDNDFSVYINQVPNCNNFCIQTINFELELSNNLEILIKDLITGTKKSNDLLVGEVRSIILYD